MIIAYIGGVGSGKTLSVVKDIVNSTNHALTNFNLKGISRYKRLKITDILKVQEKKFVGVNWDYWEKIRKEKFSIIFDEAHNLLNARASMTKRNQLMTKWVSQIRKILSDSETNHLYLITQTPRKLDINFRDLTHVVISCQKLIQGKNVYILQRYYEGFDAFYDGIVKGKSYFLGNPYFKYFDTNEMVHFQDSEIYV